MLRNYQELIKLKTFEDRYRYLRLKGTVGSRTFGSERILNQFLYSSPEWKRFRHRVIIRDRGCDLAMDGYSINGDRIIIHHINPISADDIRNRDPKIFDMDNVICVSPRTHEAIHYGDEGLLPEVPVERRPGDTCPWK